MLRCDGGGAVNLYHNNALKLDTKSDGVNITGELECDTLDVDGNVDFDGGQLTFNASANTLDFVDGAKAHFGTSDDLQIYHDGNNSAINETGTGSLFIQGSNNIYLRDFDTSENHIVMTKNGSVELYHNNVKQVQTTADGVGFVNNCTFSDNKKIKLGDSNDLQIYHDGSNSYIYQDGTGDLRINTGTFRLMNKNGDETQIYATQNGKVILYYDNSKKLETFTSGTKVTGRIEPTGGVWIGSDLKYR